MLASIVFRSIAWELFVQIRALYEAPNITSNSIRCQELFIVISRLYSIKDLKRVKNLVYTLCYKKKDRKYQLRPFVGMVMGCMLGIQYYNCTTEIVLCML